MSRLLHLDPSLPVVWRSPTSFQIGVDSPVALVESVDQRHLPVLAALHSGIHVEGVEAIASHEGLEPREITLFLDRLSAAMDAGAPDPLPLIRITGSTSHLPSFARVLLELGYRESRAAEEAVLVSSFVMSPTAYHPWLADDIPHTPVIMGDQAITIGPRVTPGRGPCLHCVWDNAVQRDPAWVAMASQLSTLSAATDTPAFHALAAWNARNMLRADTPGLVYRIDRYTQEVTTHEEEPSSSCLCRSLI